MAVKNTAQVIIGGKIITLGGYETADYFQKVASYMNNKISELSGLPGYSHLPMETRHMLLGLNISDDYFKAKKQAEVFEQDLTQKDQEMYSRGSSEERKDCTGRKKDPGRKNQGTGKRDR